MQTAFFALSGLYEKNVAIEKIKGYTKKAYSAKGPEVVEKNFLAIDQSLENLFEVDLKKQKLKEETVSKKFPFLNLLKTSPYL